MFSPRTRRNLQRILPFGLIWLVTGWFYLTLEFAAVEQTSEWADTAIRMNLKIFLFSSLVVLVVGTGLGWIEITFVHPLFAARSFGRRLLFKLVLYIVVFSVVLMIAFPVAASFELDIGVLDVRVWDKYRAFLTSKTHYATMLQMAVSQFLALFYAEMDESIGHRKLMHFFTGRYHRPVEEERIFMFVDMRSSTTIAEQLGHQAYFELLNAYYADLSEGIIDHAGEIYQYAGDEVLISWPLSEGKTDAACIRCFLQMREDLARRQSWYQKKFGVAPSFKAGIHGGRVTAGEIGTLKKEILFTSDVLNATSRIQGLCHQYQVDVLISGQLLERLHLPEGIVTKAIGETELRGKRETMVLFTLVPSGLRKGEP